MLAAVEDAAREQSWGNQEELLATLVEVTHGLLVSFLAVNTKPSDRWRIPEPLHIPRPGEKSRSMSMGELARAMTGRR